MRSLTACHGGSRGLRSAQQVQKTAIPPSFLNALAAQNGWLQYLPQQTQPYWADVCAGRHICNNGWTSNGSIGRPVIVAILHQ
jgi:hypothetical protein